MKRRLLLSCSAISLLLFAGQGWLCWTAQAHPTRVIAIGRRSVTVSVAAGELGVQVLVLKPPVRGQEADRTVDGDMNLDTTLLPRLFRYSANAGWHGFASDDLLADATWRDLLPGVSTFRLAEVPLWLTLSLTMLLPVWLSITWLCSRRLTRAGCCRACGYDLRATPARCPECGRAPVAVAI